MCLETLLPDPVYLPCCMSMSWCNIVFLLLLVYPLNLFLSLSLSLIFFCFLLCELTRYIPALIFPKYADWSILSRPHPSPSFPHIGILFFSLYFVHSSISPLVFSVSLCVTTVSPFLQFQGGYGRKKKKKEVRRYVTLSNTASLYLTSDSFTLLTYMYTCPRYTVIIYTLHTHTHREHVRKQTRSHDFFHTRQHLADRSTRHASLNHCPTPHTYTQTHTHTHTT